MICTDEAWAVAFGMPDNAWIFPDTTREYRRESIRRYEKYAGKGSYKKRRRAGVVRAVRVTMTFEVPDD